MEIILALIVVALIIFVGAPILFILLTFSITIIGWYFVPDLWRAGHDNLAVLLAIAAPIANIFIYAWLISKFEEMNNTDTDFF